jgi:hypothetical protein
MKGGAHESAGEAGSPEDHDASGSFDSFLRKVARLSDATSGQPPLWIGQIIAEKYRIDAVIGRGGMGVVFRATHLVSQKPVALKWMLRSTTDGSAHRRLLREALAAGRIDHPNVVDVYDVGQHADCAYLIMELLHGETLHARLGRDPLSPRELIDLLLPAMSGVAAAHRVGVIHRDLKPDNIFLCTGPDGEAREAKVLDFGVSAVIAQTRADSTITQGGTILGTPAYMSPEQLTSAHDSDGRTDVYAFGVILYEALTGRLPFVADTYPGLVLAIVQAEIQPPSELNPDLPHELEAIVMRALARRREDRYPTIEALQEALGDFLGSGLAAVSSRWPAKRVAPAVQFTTETSDEVGYAAVGDGQGAAHAGASGAQDGSLERPGSVHGEGLERAAGANDATRGRPVLSRAAAALGCLAALMLMARGVYLLAVDSGTRAVPESSSTGSSRSPALAAPPQVYPSAASPRARSAPQPTAAAEWVVPGARGAAALTGHGTPRSCEDARAAGIASDGLRSIDPDGPGPAKPFKVYCAGMSATADGEAAREYLPLGSEPDRNVTRYSYAGGPCPCSELVRRFTQVRIDPRTLAIDPTDGTFASYDRSLECESAHRSQCGESVNLAWGGAGSCRAQGDTSGSAAIDLRGTPFTLASDVRFVPAGFGAAGRAQISRDRKSAALVGGGLCGSLVPAQGTVRLVALR